MENVCSEYALMPLLTVIKNTLALIQIIVPILLALSASFHLFQLMKDPDNDKKGIKKVINSFTAALIVFMVPIFVNVLFQALGNNTTFSNCWNNASYNTATTYYETETKKKNKLNIDSDEYEKGDPTSQGACLSKKKTSNVLFVGNSKTYVHDIPSKFANIASSAGYKVSVSSVTEGGQTLVNLASKYSSKITSSSYDCVILQEQTDVYESGGSTYSNGIKEVTNLVRSKNKDAKVYVRALWIVNTSSSSALSHSYSATESYASANNAGVIYDGKAFERSRQQYSNISLYDDDRHQSEAGAYLSALVIYKTLSGDKTNVSYYASLGKDTAQKLQSIAAK